MTGPPSLSVEDDGAGIRVEDLDRAFEAFYRAADAGQGGSGLGLAIVREIARAHGAGGKSPAGPRSPGPGSPLFFLAPGWALT